MNIFFYSLEGRLDSNIDTVYSSWFEKFRYEYPFLFAFTIIAIVALICIAVYLICKLYNKSEMEKECPTLVTVHLVGYEDLFVRPKTNVILPTPERDGFVFRGWFLDSACTVPYISTEPVKKELILYPKWEKEVG